jgi:DedD protein
MAESREAKTDVGVLQRRGRRRLVGAVALVLLAVILLPMVFDPEPRSSAPPVSVRIPSEDGAEFKPKVTPRAPVTSGAPQKGPAEAQAGAASEPKPAAVAAAGLVEKPAAAVPEKPAAKSHAKPVEPAAKPQVAGVAAPDPGERKRAEDALAGTKFVIPVIALASPEKLKELLDMLSAAKVPHYTEQIATAKGPVTRVRAGPFDSQKVAEQTLEKLKGLGLKPGAIATRS